MLASKRKISMKKAFVIMQIGNPELDVIYKKVIVPVLENLGFDTKRVDKHTEGRLLKTEIVEFILTSDLIIADLTNERPNCYLEVGYAMGLDKFRNLILTAREDHNADSPDYKQGGPKVHFDLSGYDILFWKSNEIEEFKLELEKRIRRRLATIPSRESPWDTEWIEKHHKIAMQGLEKNNFSGYMEICMTLRDIKTKYALEDLKETAYKAQINTFGWPIGAMDITNTKFTPKPTRKGIVQNLYGEDFYDYWTIKKEGSFYLLKNLFEDTRSTKKIFFDTRIIRITETLLYAVRLYSGLNISSDAILLIKIHHSGLKGRTMSATRQRRGFQTKTSIENEIETEVETPIEKIESNLSPL
jgi:hypothetical protein